MPRTSQPSAARARILKTASDLFYSKGYRATGINEIIAKSGVAKQTFYDHFPSKESLAYAYVQQMNERELQLTKEVLAGVQGPYQKLITYIESLIPWSEANDYRGCGYLNIASEIPDARNPARREGKYHYEAIRAIVRDLVEDLKRERGAAWKDRDAAKITSDYLLILAGALAMAQIYHDPEPYKAALESVKRLLA
jgi:AcrR family transcriptional regulator